MAGCGDYIRLFYFRPYHINKYRLGKCNTMRICVVFLALLCLVSSAIVNYGNYDNNIPSYTYPVQLNAGDSLQATLSWPNSEDLDLYLYRAGQDLLSRGTWLAREFSGNLNP